MVSAAAGETNAADASSAKDERITTLLIIEDSRLHDCRQTIRPDFPLVNEQCGKDQGFERIATYGG
jgi:hypothetical protein